MSKNTVLTRKILFIIGMCNRVRPFYKPIWQLSVYERKHNADSEHTFLFKIEGSPA